MLYLSMLPTSRLPALRSTDSIDLANKCTMLRKFRGKEWPNITLGKVPHSKKAKVRYADPQSGTYSHLNNKLMHLYYYTTPLFSFAICYYSIK